SEEEIGSAGVEAPKMELIAWVSGAPRFELPWRSGATRIQRDPRLPGPEERSAGFTPLSPDRSVPRATADWCGVRRPFPDQPRVAHPVGDVPWFHPGIGVQTTISLE